MRYGPLVVFRLIFHDFLETLRNVNGLLEALESQSLYFVRCVVACFAGRVDLKIGRWRIESKC